MAEMTIKSVPGTTGKMTQVPGEATTVTAVAHIPMPTTHHFRQSGSLDFPNKRTPTSNSLSLAQSTTAHCSLPLSLCDAVGVQNNRLPDSSESPR